jgi:hypothetical protein
MFNDLSSVSKVCTVGDQPQLHELRPGKYVDVKRATGQEDMPRRNTGNSFERQSNKPRLSNACLDCGKRNPKYGMPNEQKKRWCGDCAQKSHPDAVKNRTSKESNFAQHHSSGGA